MLLLGLFKHDVLALPSDCITTKKKKIKILGSSSQDSVPKDRRRRVGERNPQCNDLWR